MRSSRQKPARPAGSGTLCAGMEVGPTFFLLRLSIQLTSVLPSLQQAFREVLYTQYLI